MLYRAIVASMLQAVNPASVQLRYKHRLVIRNYWVKVSGQEHMSAA